MSIYRLKLVYDPGMYSQYNGDITNSLGKAIVRMSRLKRDYRTVNSFMNTCFQNRFTYIYYFVKRHRIFA